MNLDKTRALAKGLLSLHLQPKTLAEIADAKDTIRLARACLALCDVAELVRTCNCCGGADAARTPAALDALASLARLLEELGL